MKYWYVFKLGTDWEAQLMLTSQIVVIFCSQATDQAMPTLPYSGYLQSLNAQLNTPIHRIYDINKEISKGSADG